MFLHRNDIEMVAGRFQIRPNLIHAVVLVESSGNRHAWNPEPKYKWLWDVKKNAPFRKLTDGESMDESPPNDFHGYKGSDRDQEWWGQQASWGLMQIMGAVARELGFQEVFFTALCETGYGLHFGTTHLKNLLGWAKGDESAALAAYNGGKAGNGPGITPKRNQKYVDKVMREAEKLVSEGFSDLI